MSPTRKPYVPPVPPEWEERPTLNDRGKWDALDANGYGHSLDYATEDEVRIWLNGYSCGASENM